MAKLLLLSTLIALSLNAQQPTLVESVEVRVVNVDVVVTDRAGKPVTGLTKDDFEILENGKPQTITNFSAYVAPDFSRADRPAEAGRHVSPPRFFLLFIDTHSLHPVLKKQILASTRKFVDEQVRATDQVSVVSWNRALKFHTPLTSDKQVVHRAIDAAAAEGSPTSVNSDFARVQQQCTNSLQLVRSGRLPILAAYHECISFARGEAARTTVVSRQLLAAVNVALATLGGVDGKKILLLAGGELPQKPGLEMFQWANQIFAPYMRGFDAPMARPEDESEKQHEILDHLGRIANQNAVTMYLISAPTSADLNSARNASAIDDGGGDFLHRGNTDAAHQTLATLTGGRAAHVSQVDSALSTLARDLDSYYSLGYRPAGDTKEDRAITVRTKNRAHVVRARQTYAAKTLDDRMSDRVVANIFTPAPEGEWKITVRTGTPRPGEKGHFIVPIDIRIPASALTLLPEGSTLAGAYTVFVAVGSPQGALSTLFRQPQPVKIRADEEAAFRRDPLLFSATLTVRAGENLLSVGVVDQLSNTAGFARATIVASAANR